jgi:hypothetical protein
MEDGIRVFNKMAYQIAVSWTAMIFKYVEFGEGQNTSDLVLTKFATGRCPAKPCHFWVVLNASTQCHLKMAGVLLKRSFRVVVTQMSLLGIALLSCMQNVRAWKVFSKMAFHDLISWKCPAWGIVACMDMVRKLLSIFNQCVKKV